MTTESKRKFIEWRKYTCWIWTNKIETYEVWTYKIANKIWWWISWYFSFSNGSYSNIELRYKYTTWNNAYRVISARLIK